MARTMSLEDIEEAKTGIWIEQQLHRIRKLLVEHGADDEMLVAVDFLLEENAEYWGAHDLPVPPEGEA